MSFENLKSRALAVYVLSSRMSNYGYVFEHTRYKNKKVKQLRILRSLGINGLSIGVESGDDSTLALSSST